MSAATLPQRGVYGITSAVLCADPPQLFAAVEAALKGGLALLQYRDKHSAPAQKLYLAQNLLVLCKEANVPLIINDDVLLTKQIGADGAHLGADDASIVDARAYLGANVIIGATCGDSIARAEAAQQLGASYVAFGAIYPSTTKPNAQSAALSCVRLAKQQIHLPVCAIGGITLQNAAAVIAGGADYIAAVDGIFGAADITQAVQELAILFKS